MDLVSNPDETKVCISQNHAPGLSDPAPQVIVVTDHVDKNGRPKVVEECSLPMTGVRCVSRIITDLCVFDVNREGGGLTLVELAEGATAEDIKAKTGASFTVAERLGSWS